MKKLPKGQQPKGPVTIRLSDQAQSDLDFCAEKTGMKVTDLMRLCMSIGMEHFKRIDYDTAKCIVEAVEAKKNIIQTTESDFSKPSASPVYGGSSSPDISQVAEEHNKHSED